MISQHLIVLRYFDIVYSFPAQNFLSSFGSG